MTRRKKADTLMILGSLFLVLAGAVFRFVHPVTAYGVDLEDGFRGLLYGAGIGLLGLSVWTRNRSRKCAE